MKDLNNEMKKIALFLEKFVHKSNGCYVDINFSKDNDIEKICKQFVVCLSYTNTVFRRKVKHPSYNFDYTINLICKESEKNDIIFDNSKILWTKEATIIFNVKDASKIRNIVAEELNSIFDKYMKHNEPMSFTMCIPPEQGDPNYRKHMNEYIKNKIEGKI